MARRKNKGLPGKGPVRDINGKAKFENILANANVPVVVDFWAPWCAPCRTQGPVLEEAARSFGGKLKVIKVDIDKNQDLAEQFGIKSIPALLIFDGGKVVERKVGLTSKAELSSMANRVVAGRG